ncbi:MAG TPA: hypothetical protein VM737_05770 [Gemmatimonadota bacterium]|nr:hypothetical protein [Gemmatimonadota bacterium]
MRAFPEIAAAYLHGSAARARPDFHLEVRDLEDLPLVVRGRVLTEGALIGSNDESRRVSFETRTRLQYFDFLPYHTKDVTEGLVALRRKHLGG